MVNGQWSMVNIMEKRISFFFSLATKRQINDFLAIKANIVNDIKFLVSKNKLQIHKKTMSTKCVFGVCVIANFADVIYKMIAFGMFQSYNIDSS